MSDKLSEHLDNEVITFLKKKPGILELLRDWLILVNYTGEGSISRPDCDEVTGRIKGYPVTKLSTLYYDYSFLIAPAYKAFEGYLYLLAESLGLKKTTDEIHNIGSLYDSEKIERIKEEIVTETGEKIDKNDKQGMGMINGLRIALRCYRHNPAHFEGRTDTFQKAKDYGSMIFSVINDTTKYFLTKEIIKNF